MNKAEQVIPDGVRYRVELEGPNWGNGADKAIIIVNAIDEESATEYALWQYEQWNPSGAAYTHVTSVHETDYQPTNY